MGLPVEGSFWILRSSARWSERSCKLSPILVRSRSQLPKSPLAGEAPAALVFIDGKKFRTLRGPNIATEFKAMVIDYIDQRYGAAANVPTSTVTAAE